MNIKKVIWVILLGLGLVGFWVVASREVTFCPSGFSFYENEKYSLCYPSQMKLGVDENVVDPASGEIEKDVVTFTDLSNNSEITVIPNFSASGGGGECEAVTPVVVTNYPAERITKGCGEPFEIATKVDVGTKQQFWLLYQAFDGGRLLYAPSYETIEKSLKIKM